MRKFKFAVILFFVFLTACASRENAEYKSQSPAGVAENNTTSVDLNQKGDKSSGGKMLSDAPAAQVSLNKAEQTQTAPTVVTERKIIRDADLQLETDAPEEAQNKISAIAESKGGFVVETQSSSSDVKAATRDTVTMSVRVPAAKFNEALDEIRKSASRVINETVKGQDVTEEFIDVEARLKAKKALEEQFLEIMKRSNSVADALNVQRELGNVRGEIEQIEGRKRFLENQSSLSTVKITLKTPAVFSAASKGFFSRLAESVGGGFDIALNFILFFVSAAIALLPFLILIVLPIYLLIRYLLKRNRKQKLASEIAREEIKGE